MQDWRATPQLTLTYGVRYTLLQPPYETNGTQVAPSISLDNFFNQRAAAMMAGQTYNPLVQFDLSGRLTIGRLIGIGTTEMLRLDWHLPGLRKPIVGSYSEYSEALEEFYPRRLWNLL